MLASTCCRYIFSSRMPNTATVFPLRAALCPRSPPRCTTSRANSVRQKSSANAERAASPTESSREWLSGTDPPRVKEIRIHHPAADAHSDDKIKPATARTRSRVLLCGLLISPAPPRAILVVPSPSRGWKIYLIPLIFPCRGGVRMVIFSLLGGPII